MLSNTAVPKYYGEFRDRVLAGQIPVCEFISLQMQRIDNDIRNPNYFYDDEAIEGYIRFCETELTLTDGSPLLLLPSFKLWAEDVLAWYQFVDKPWFNPETGETEVIRVKQRLRNKQYLIVPRASAKSLYMTTHHAYGLTVDTDSTDQVTTAPTMKQGLEVLTPLSTAIVKARGPFFKALTDGNNKSRSTYSQAKLASTKIGIENKLTNSKLEVKPMRIDKLQGSRAKYATVDEWLSGEIKEDVVGAIEQSAAKGGIDDYLIIAASSEGTVRDSVGDSIKLELMKILRGEYVNDNVSIFYYRADDIKEIYDPRLWVKASPNIGATVSYEIYQRDLERAENNLQARNDILAKRWGIPVEGSTHFFTYEETALHPRQNYSGMQCAMGMDASQGDDFWAFTWLFNLGNGRFGVKTKSFVSEVKYLKLPSAMQAKYDQFVREGTLVIMNGPILNWVDVYDNVMSYVLENDYAVTTVGFDTYNARDFMTRWSTENGGYGIEKVIQGAKTESVPLGELKNLAGSRDLIFDEELMKFAMGNAVVLQDNNGNFKLSKRRSGDKIDNVAALMDSWVAYKRNQEAFM